MREREKSESCRPKWTLSLPTTFFFLYTQYSYGIYDERRAKFGLQAIRARLFEILLFFLHRAALPISLSYPFHSPIALRTYLYRYVKYLRTYVHIIYVRYGTRTVYMYYVTYNVGFIIWRTCCSLRPLPPFFFFFFRE